LNDRCIRYVTEVYCTCRCSPHP